MRCRFVQPLQDSQKTCVPLHHLHVPRSVLIYNLPACATYTPPRDAFATRHRWATVSEPFLPEFPNPTSSGTTTPHSSRCVSVLKRPHGSSIRIYFFSLPNQNGQRTQPYGSWAETSIDARFGACLPVLSKRGPHQATPSPSLQGLRQSLYLRQGSIARCR